MEIFQQQAEEVSLPERGYGVVYRVKIVFYVDLCFQLKVKHHFAVEQYERERIMAIEERNEYAKKCEVAEIQNGKLKQLLESMKGELIHKVYHFYCYCCRPMGIL